MKSNRLEDRELCADLVRVRWEPESGPAQDEWAVLDDISSSGACLEIEQSIKPGTLLSLEFPGDRCQATVKYCKSVLTNYLIGVKFEQGYRWSRRRFKPEHLIQFRLRSVPKKR